MKYYIATAAALLLAAPAFATPPNHKSEPQTATAKLMAAQRSGELASGNEQYLSGKARSEIYQRYVKSFSQPIPDSFIDETFTND
ncbi:Protein of unknown function (DUF3613) [Spongiibacter sp. IMCC21906]|jgi:hypothetical protein|uniref:DUF3613 domain-containing protein n=1 Tax=Spongiibacter sp. IMCC21906 TaxID=1620392 RepID=UPI00062DD035|nr:DUF3613 domain-containing protein [Spongiibacter sp. IMCC21906]AKH69583.1 Protein of unknown function (DUF3613) [Spongiibacter sp. IMCC21906]